MKTELNRTRTPGLIGLGLVVVAGCLRLSAAPVDAAKLPPPATVTIDFARDIRPILETSCLRCHGPEKSKSGFRLDQREAALKGGETGVDIHPGASAKSRLIHYVAGLVEDMEMPPVGKGEPLTPAQVGLLRAWIDQDVVWDNSKPANSFEVSVSPTFGGTAVSGDRHKFREHFWQREGLNGGVEEFHLFDQPNFDTTVFAAGHALLNDYKLELSVNRNEWFFVHAGGEQYRKYFDDTGGFFPAILPTAPSLGEDLHLDIGRAWVDFGLTLPDWPVLVLGYEHDYKRGNESLTQWGASGPNNSARNFLPASRSLNEEVHILKFDLNDEIRGVGIEERFRGEFYDFKTSSTNVATHLLPQATSEGTTYFQGANTVRLEKQFNDWFFGSAGYLYSHLNGDSSFNLEDVTRLQQTVVPQITLQRESHVGNLNGFLGPFDGLAITTGVQVERTRQQSFGPGVFTQVISPSPLETFVEPFSLASDYDKTSVQETLSLRYTKIPFTSLFAEGRFEQQKIGQFDQFAATQDILDSAVFLQNTAFSSHSSDLRVGFSTSPWQTASLSAHYRRYDDQSDYNSDAVQKLTPTAYPTFIRSRDLLTDEAEARLVLRPFARWKTSVTYHYQVTHYTLDTAPFTTGPFIISPGGNLTAGRDSSHTVALNATVNPTARFYLSSTFSYQNSRLTTEQADSPAVVPYRGNIYTVLADGTYVLSQATELFSGYAFSQANYSQGDFAAGLPLGIEYHQQAVQAGLSHRFSKNVSAKLQYRFAYYNEPSSGGANNYHAHSVFCTWTFLFH